MEDAITTIVKSLKAMTYITPYSYVEDEDKLRKLESCGARPLLYCQRATSSGTLVSVRILALEVDNIADTAREGPHGLERLRGMLDDSVGVDLAFMGDPQLEQGVRMHFSVTHVDSALPIVLARHVSSEIAIGLVSRLFSIEILHGADLEEIMSRLVRQSVDPRFLVPAPSITRTDDASFERSSNVATDGRSRKSKRPDVGDTISDAKSSEISVWRTRAQQFPGADSGYAESTANQKRRVACMWVEFAELQEWNPASGNVAQVEEFLNSDTLSRRNLSDNTKSIYRQHLSEWFDKWSDQSDAARTVRVDKAAAVTQTGRNIEISVWRTRAQQFPGADSGYAESTANQKRRVACMWVEFAELQEWNPASGNVAQVEEFLNSDTLSRRNLSDNTKSIYRQHLSEWFDKW